MKLLGAGLTLLPLCGQALGRQLSRAAPDANALAADTSPIRRVITLIEEMKQQVDKDATEDLAAYEKFACWCKTNEKAKAAAVEEAGARIEELGAFIEEAAAKVGELKTSIDSLEADISEDKEALAAAVAAREKESAAFQAEEADVKETRALLTEAIDVLSKVQLLQKAGKAPAAAQAQARAALVQVQEKIRRSARPAFAAVLQRDFFDMLGAMGDAPGLRGSAAFEQSAAQPLSEGEAGLAAKPNELQGAAAGAKSYSSRSGGILGLLTEMRDQFVADLASSQRQDLEAEASFQSLKAAKTGEISIAAEQKVRKEAELADTMDARAKAEEDREATTKAMEADDDFLSTMRKDCKTQDEQYKARAKVRGDEQVALAETLKILTEDDARDLYEKTGSFLQLASKSRAAARDRAARKALKHLAAVAVRHKNFALAAIAARGGLDAFAKVKEAMDKMLAELQRQQKEEYEKREFCNKEIDRLEDEIKSGKVTQEDLNEKHQRLENSLEALRRDIEALATEEQEMQASLKEAGENRKAENQLYQTSIMDQRATINILNKAMKRLKSFYAPALLQEPGRAVAPRPDTPKAYDKSAGAGGVMRLLAKIVKDAEAEVAEMAADEQHAQEQYGAFVQTTARAIEAGRAARAEKAALVAEAESEKSETEAALLSNGESLDKLGDLLKAQHLDCDWLLKYFTVRQQSRVEEMDAITDAKAVLSGADFGK